MIKTKWNFGLVLIIGFLSACTPTIKETVGTVEPALETKVIKPVVISPVVIKDEKTSQPVKLDVLLLLSSSASSYQKIANYLVDALEGHVIKFTLSGLPAQDMAVIENIKSSSSVQIVALGLKATNAVKGLKNKQIIYTKVINHHNLSAANVKAVSSLPSPEKLFKDWKLLSPHLSRVAVITGKNLGLYLQRAKKAAKAQGIELIIEQVNSDKAFLYKSKKLSANVGGQWILPDNRVLSGKALKEVMAFASRRGRQIVVFSPKLLSFGGFFYVTPDLQAIANAVLQRLTESAGSTTVLGANVLPVLNHTMGINQNIASQFNLLIPQQYRKYINGK